MKIKILILLIISILFVVVFTTFSEYRALRLINNYEDCAKAKGSTIQYMYPPTCVTKIGGLFHQATKQEVPIVDSTPSPLGSTQPSPINSSSSLTTIRYSMPQEWALWSSMDEAFSFAYDSSRYNEPLREGDFISLLGQSVGRSIFMRFSSYDGGSRHLFLKNQTGYTKLGNTYEKEYLIDGKSALFIFQVELSSNCSAGVIFASPNTALVVTSSICDSDGLEPFLSTFKFAN